MTPNGFKSWVPVFYADIARAKLKRFGDPASADDECVDSLRAQHRVEFAIEERTLAIALQHRLSGFRRQFRHDGDALSPLDEDFSFADRLPELSQLAAVSPVVTERKMKRRSLPSAFAPASTIFPTVALPIIAKTGCKPVSTLLGVTRLLEPPSRRL